MLGILLRGAIYLSLSRECQQNDHKDGSCARTLEVCPNLWLKDVAPASTRLLGMVLSDD